MTLKTNDERNKCRLQDSSIEHKITYSQFFSVWFKIQQLEISGFFFFQLFFYTESNDLFWVQQHRQLDHGGRKSRKTKVYIFWFDCAGKDPLWGSVVTEGDWYSLFVVVRVYSCGDTGSANWTIAPQGDILLVPGSLWSQHSQQTTLFGVFFGLETSYLICIELTATNTITQAYMKLI